MLPGVHCHIFLPVHSHLPLCQAAASQSLHDLNMMLPEVHCHILLPVHSHLPLVKQQPDNCLITLI
jgi:hypothetical protein